MGGFVAIPTVELADQADALGVGRPHGERHATHHTVGRGKRAGVGTQDFPKPFVAALGEQVQVDLAQGGQESVRIGHGVWLATFIGHLQAVVDEVDERQCDGKQARIEVLQREPVLTNERDDLDGMRTERSDDGMVVVFVGAQDAVRVVMCTRHQARHFGRLGCKVLPGEFLGSTHEPVTSCAAACFGSRRARLAC